jgi:hypothetical protein
MSNQAQSKAAEHRESATKSHRAAAETGAPSLGEQSMNENEQMIREQAYELWDHAGRPDGRGDEFWFAARAVCDDAGDGI